MIDLFGVNFASKLGIMTVMNSPASYVAVPIAALIEADAALTAALVTIHYFVSLGMYI